MVDICWTQVIDQNRFFISVQNSKFVFYLIHLMQKYKWCTSMNYAVFFLAEIAIKYRKREKNNF